MGVLKKESLFTNSTWFLSVLLTMRTQCNAHRMVMKQLQENLIKQLKDNSKSLENKFALSL